MDMLSVMLLVGVWLPPGTLETLGPLVEEHTLDTPWGRVGPVAQRRVGEAQALWILPYSGSPMRTDPRGTMWAARHWNLEYVLGWDAVVALNPLLRRGDNVIINDYIDATRRQPVAMADDRDSGWQTGIPSLCGKMQDCLRVALPMARDGAVYLATDTPRRETKAEARMLRLWGADVIGQNLVPEAAFAHELGLCFAGLGTVTEVGAEQPQMPPEDEVIAATRRVVNALPTFLTTLAEVAHR